MSAIGIRLLKLLHPKSETQRMETRMCLARAFAEVEDLHRTLNGHMKPHAPQGIVLKKK